MSTTTKLSILTFFHPLSLLESIQESPLPEFGESSLTYPEDTNPQSPPTQQQNQQLPEDHTLSLCLRKNEDILIHQYRVSSDDYSRNGDTFQYAVEYVGTAQVEIHQWQLLQGELMPIEWQMSSSIL